MTPCLHIRENAPETDTELLQQLVSNSTPQQSKMASSSPGLEDRRLRTLQKKLRQIQELKEREAKGEKLEASQVIESSGWRRVLPWAFRSSHAALSLFPFHLLSCRLKRLPKNLKSDWKLQKRTSCKYNYANGSNRHV